MPNHIHLLVKIKDKNQLQAHYQAKKETEQVLNDDDFPKFVSREFGSFFSSYSQAFNKQNRRKGSLFVPNFKRKWVDSDRYFTQVVHYIHTNPVNHGFVRDMAEWKHSSFLSFLSDYNTNLQREEVLKWFGGTANYLKFHQEMPTKLMDDFE